MEPTNKVQESRSVVFVGNSFANRIQVFTGKKSEKIDSSTLAADLKATEIAHDDSEEDIDEAEKLKRKENVFKTLNCFADQLD